MVAAPLGRLSWWASSYSAVTDTREITPYVWVHPNEDNRQMMEPVRLPNA